MVDATHNGKNLLPLVSNQEEATSCLQKLSNCLMLPSTEAFEVLALSSLTMAQILLPHLKQVLGFGEERANLSAFRTFVRFVLVWICRVPLPLSVWEGLRFVIVALPGLFSYLFFRHLSAVYFFSLSLSLSFSLSLSLSLGDNLTEILLTGPLNNSNKAFFMCYGLDQQSFQH